MKHLSHYLIALFTITERSMLCLLFVSLFIASCREKNKNVTPKCEGYFVSVFNGGSTTEPRYVICFTNTENNDGFKNLHDLSFFSFMGGAGYNWRNGLYYYISSWKTGSPEREFRYFSVGLLKEIELGTSELNDTSKHAPMYTFMICNTLTDIVYCFAEQGDTCKLYEVSHNGIFDIRQIGVFDTGYNTRTAAVDETSGCIFVLHGKTLKKIDPNTGNTSDVATYTDADPGWLNYNDNDKMFYAIDRRGQYRLLRINPADGALSVQGIMNGLDTVNYCYITFDRCNNQLIFIQPEKPASTFYRDAFWINLKDASVASSLPHIWASQVVAYENGKIPKKN